MGLTTLGGGFRVPLAHKALLTDGAVTSLVLHDHALALVTSVKAVERSVIEAASSGSRAAALRAFAANPLVDSVSVAARLLDRHVEEHPELACLRRP
ncbi:hypothetical protein [Kutzneria sp. NPDC052558]|uniref:family 4 glycosyl hydrolase n=1 Tax=Kutzneria sp. NPDC052558 TaxID=3364121 RepID=UPI0037C595DF